MWLRGRAWEAKLNQFREDMRAAKYLLRSGLRISEFWNPVVLDWSETVLSQSWCRLLECFRHLLLITCHCNTVGCEVHACWYRDLRWKDRYRLSFKFSARCRKTELWAWAVMVIQARVKSGRTGQILESGKNLYCIYTAQQKDSEGSWSVHTRNCVWLKIWTLCS